MSIATTEILLGDAREVLQTLADESVQCVVTSPPYFNLRDYGVEKQIGVERTITEYTQALQATFSEVMRVLKSDGTLWVNVGDSYKNKHLLGVPWRVAFALKDQGWILRADIIWHKTNAFPENVYDKPTKNHEYLFLFSKSKRYYYDIDSIREPHILSKEQFDKAAENYRTKGKHRAVQHAGDSTRFSGGQHPLGKNKRTVWSLATASYKDAHFAVFPPRLVEPCIKAGSREGDTVLDPFFGSGTTGVVANQLGRNCIGIELNPEYVELAKKRLANGKE